MWGVVDEGFLIHFYALFWTKIIASCTLQTAIHASLLLQIPLLVCKVSGKSRDYDDIKENMLNLPLIKAHFKPLTPRSNL